MYHISRALSRPCTERSGISTADAVAASNRRVIGLEMQGGERPLLGGKVPRKGSGDTLPSLVSGETRLHEVVRGLGGRNARQVDG